MRVGYNFKDNKVTWNTARPISNAVAEKWITKLNKDDLYMKQGLNVQHKGINYKVYLNRYETDGTWQLLPDAVLFVDKA